MFSIRKASVADIAIIQELARQTWPETFGRILTPDQIAYMLEMMYSTSSLQQQMTVSEHCFLLGFEADTPVGYTSYQLNYLPDTCKLHKLYVLPKGQKNGYGKLLFSAVAKTAHNAGQLSLRLDVNYQNAAATFYERMGMVKVDEVTTEIGEGYLMEDWVYECSLAEPLKL